MKKISFLLSIIVFGFITLKDLHAENTYLDFSNIEKNIFNRNAVYEYQLKILKLEIKDFPLTKEVHDQVKSMMNNLGHNENDANYKEIYDHHLNQYLKQNRSRYSLLQITKTKDYQIYANKTLKDIVDDKTVSEINDFDTVQVIDNNNKKGYYEICRFIPNVTEYKNDRWTRSELTDLLLFPELVFAQTYQTDKERCLKLYKKIDKSDNAFFASSLQDTLNYYEDQYGLKAKAIFGFTKTDNRLVEVIGHRDTTIYSTEKWMNFRDNKSFRYAIDYENLWYDDNKKIQHGINYHILDLKENDEFPRYASIQEIIIKNSKPEYKYVVVESGKEEKKGTVGEYL